MNKLNFFGVGPKIGVVLIPWLAISIVLSCASDYFIYSHQYSADLLLAGSVLLILGLIFYFTSVRLLLNGLKDQRLVTGGTFSLCQNPLYASFILFIIPALSLMLNSWLVLTSSLAGFILFKFYIHREYQDLEKFFGEDYLKYKREIPEFFPLPVKKWLKRI